LPRIASPAQPRRRSRHGRGRDEHLGPHGRSNLDPLSCGLASPDDMHRDANPTLNSSIAPCRSCTESKGSACGLARHIGSLVVERGLSAGDQRDVGLDVVAVSYQRDGRHHGRPGGRRRGPGHDDGVIAAEVSAGPGERRTY
jgi:hypothetical protein